MVFAALLVFMVSSAATAAEWNFYGSARVSTFYTDFTGDIFRPTGNAPGSAYGALQGLIEGTGLDTKNYEQDLNGNARIGANVKVSDTLSGRFEYGAKNGSANMRILWGEWDFGAGSLGVGQHYTPLLFPYSNQVYNVYGKKDGDTNMSLFGMLYGKRKSMVRLKFGNFMVAAVEPKTTVYYHHDITLGQAAVASQPTKEARLPAIQAKYKIDFDQGHINLAGGYSTFKVKNAGIDYDVNSYVLALGGRVNVGKAYFKGNVWGGQNVGNLADIAVNGALVSTTTDGRSTNDGPGLGFAKFNSRAALGKIGVTDNDALAGLIVAGYEIRKGLYLEAGWGYTSTELDEATATKDDSEAYYLQATIFLAPGVFLTPEIGRWDAKQENQPDVKYFGVKWQINF